MKSELAPLCRFFSKNHGEDFVSFDEYIADMKVRPSVNEYWTGVDTISVRSFTRARVRVFLSMLRKHTRILMYRRITASISMRRSITRAVSLGRVTPCHDASRETAVSSLVLALTAHAVSPRALFPSVVGPRAVRVLAAACRRTKRRSTTSPPTRASRRRCRPPSRRQLRSGEMEYWNCTNYSEIFIRKVCQAGVCYCFSMGGSTRMLAVLQGLIPPWRKQAAFSFPTLTAVFGVVSSIGRCPSIPRSTVPALTLK